MNVSPRAIHHLNCGTMCPRGARMLAGEGGLLERARSICHCLLIEGADGLVLVDTGFGRGDVERPRQLGRVFTALVSPRLSLADTHLDLDHSGGLPDFPDAEVHLLSRELAAALHPGLRDRTRYIPAHWAHGPRWVEHEAAGEQWHGFEGVRILPGSDAEILLIPLAGHTLGHTGVAIRTADGWLLHCGDAFFHHGEVQTPPHCPPGLRAFQNLNQTNGALRRQNVERLRELAARAAGEVTLLCSHDATTFEQMQQSA
jgi:glyoxylase-like metal-dependent hydrolase (beta-lactamase superfamily II)